MKTYAAVLAGCVAVTAPLEAVLGARVYRRPRRWLGAVAAGAAPFLAWDALATRAGWWDFDREQLAGPRLGNLPVEEVAFFLVVPTCALLSLEGVRALWPAG